MSDLNELADRCEAATGPDREVDLLIMRWCENIGGDPANALPYTASLDAAMTLVPEGLSFTLWGHNDGAHCEVFRFHPSKGLLGDVENAASPALALAAAALRARGQS